MCTMNIVQGHDHFFDLDQVEFSVPLLRQALFEGNGICVGKGKLDDKEFSATFSKCILIIVAMYSMRTLFKL